jgi:hypothetical protein
MILTMISWNGMKFEGLRAPFFIGDSYRMRYLFQVQNEVLRNYFHGIASGLRAKPRSSWLWPD